MAKHATDHAVYYLGGGVEVCLHPYSKDIAMAFDPASGRARVKLYGVPLENWNRGDIEAIVSGFGYLIKIGPLFSDENYEVITALVACKNAMQIPKNVSLNVDPYETKVEVEIDGWLQNQGRFPPQFMDNPYNRTGGRSRNNNGGNGGGNTDAPEGSRRRRDSDYDEGEAREGGQRGRRSNSSSSPADMRDETDQWARHDEKGKSPVLQNGEDTDLMEKEKSGAIKDNNGRLQESRTINSQDLHDNLVKFQITEGGRHVISKAGQKLLQLSVIDPMPLDTQFSMGQINQNFIAESGPMRAQKVLMLDFVTHEERVQMNEAKAHIASLKSTATEEQKDQYMSSTDEDNDITNGPPPGFYGPPKYNIENVRRSPRLREKNNGVRVRYNSPKKGKKKSNAMKPARLEYLQSFQPISQTQARLVVNMAGVEVSPDMKQKLEAVINGE